MLLINYTIIMDFETLGINSTLTSQLNKDNISEPTQIQQVVIPKILSGVSVLATSQTGSGKTLAYLLPLVQLLTKPKVDNQIQAVILAPTRELAQQIGSVCATLCEATELLYTVLYGGVEYAPQIESLSRMPHIIIATPGRMIDLLEQNSFKINELKYFVLDEVDQMLDLGFREPIVNLSKLRAKSAMTLCFSATVPEKVSKIVLELDGNIENIVIDNQKLAVELIEQYGFFVEQRMMDPLLLHVLRSEKPKHAILFTRSRKMADRLKKILVENDMSAEAMHSDRSQAARQHILGRFKSGETQIIVATDLIARGIDVENVTHVINYGLPQDPEQYIHRIGRTGRAGRAGRAISLCSPLEKTLLGATCKLMKQNILMSTNHPYQTAELTTMMALVDAPVKQPKAKKKHR